MRPDHAYAYAYAYTYAYAENYTDTEAASNAAAASVAPIGMFRRELATEAREFPACGALMICSGRRAAREVKLNCSGGRAA